METQRQQLPLASSVLIQSRLFLKADSGVFCLIPGHFIYWWSEGQVKVYISSSTFTQPIITVSHSLQAEIINQDCH